MENKIFERVELLIGSEGLQCLQNSHVMVIGLGGVGSWAAESLARSGIGRLSLVDFDYVCESNINRQVPALNKTIGRKKVEIMGERLKSISSILQLDLLDQIYNEETSSFILDHKPDFIIDAIDQLGVKAHLLSECKKRNISVISSCGAGGRSDPSKVRIDDLAKTHSDPLAAQLRRVLKQNYQFPRKGDFMISAVFSEEKPKKAVVLKKITSQEAESSSESKLKTRPINGTLCFVTGTFGFFLASWVIRSLLEKACQKTIL